MASPDVRAFDTADDSIAPPIEVNNETEDAGLSSEDSVEQTKDAEAHVSNSLFATELTSNNIQNSENEKIDPGISIADRRLAIEDSVTPSASTAERLFPSKGLAPDASLPLAASKTKVVGLKPRIRKCPAYNPLMLSKPKHTKANSEERHNLVALPQNLGTGVHRRQTEIVEAPLVDIHQPPCRTLFTKYTKAAQRYAAAIAKKSTARKAATTPVVEITATQHQQYIVELK